MDDVDINRVGRLRIFDWDSLSAILTLVRWLVSYNHRISCRKEIYTISIDSGSYAKGGGVIIVVVG